MACSLEDVLRLSSQDYPTGFGQLLYAVFNPVISSAFKCNNVDTLISISISLPNPNPDLKPIVPEPQHLKYFPMSKKLILALIPGTIKLEKQLRFQKYLTVGKVQLRSTAP